MLTGLLITKLKVMSNYISQPLFTTLKEDVILYAHTSFTSARINILTAPPPPK